MVLASVVFCVSTSLTRSALAYHGIPARMLVSLRGPFMGAISLFYSFVLSNDKSGGRVSFWKSDSNPLPLSSVSVLLLRSVLGAISLMLGFLSIKLVNLGVVVTAYFLSPLFITLLTHMVQAERIKARELFAILLGFSGAITMSNPSLGFETEQARTHAFGVCLSILASLFISMSVVLTRISNSCPQCPATAVALTIAVTMLGTLMGGTTLDELSHNGKAMSLALCACISGFCGQCIIKKASQYCSLGSGSPMRTVRIPMAYLLGYIALGEVPNTISVVGSALVAVSVALLGRPW